MEIQMSEKPAETSAAIHTAEISAATSNLQNITNLSSFIAEHRVNIDLQRLDTTLEAREHFRHGINSVAVGVDVRATSFDSMKEITECLLERNQEVDKLVLGSKKDAGCNNLETFELVEEYFENCLKTVDICTALDNFSKQAQNVQLPVSEAGNGDEENRYLKSLEKLRNLKSARDTFGKTFGNLSVLLKKILIFKKLQRQKNKLEKKMKSIRSWHKVFSIIFVVIFAAVLISSVVAAAVTSGTVTEVLSALAAFPWGSILEWVNSSWKNWANNVYCEKKIVIAMQVGTSMAFNDLDRIWTLMNEIKSDFAMEKSDCSKEEALKIGTAGIKTKLDVLVEKIEDLGVKANACSRVVYSAMTMVRRRVIKNSKH